MADCSKPNYYSDRRINMYNPHLSDSSNFWRTLCTAFIILFLGVSVLAIHFTTSTYSEKILVMKGLAYYTNDVNGEVIFKLKEIK